MVLTRKYRGSSAPGDLGGEDAGARGHTTHVVIDGNQEREQDSPGCYVLWESINRCPCRRMRSLSTSSSSSEDSSSSSSSTTSSSDSDGTGSRRRSRTRSRGRSRGRSRSHSKKHKENKRTNKEMKKFRKKQHKQWKKTMKKRYGKHPSGARPILGASMGGPPPPPPPPQAGEMPGPMPPPGPHGPSRNHWLGRRFGYGYHHGPMGRHHDRHHHRMRRHLRWGPREHHRPVGFELPMGCCVRGWPHGCH